MEQRRVSCAGGQGGGVGEAVRGEGGVILHIEVQYCVLYKGLKKNLFKRMENYTLSIGLNGEELVQALALQREGHRFESVCTELS